MTAQRITTAGGHRGEAGHGHYTAADVFSDTYGLPAMTPSTLTLPAGFDDRVTSLRQLLMRWFGYKDEAEVEPTPEGPNGDDDDDVVDRQETFPPPASSPGRTTQSARAVTENDRRRALQMLKQVTEQMSSEAYLKERPPETLSIDIQFASVLLRAGLCEGWITEGEFFASTHQIWTPLFFTSSPVPTRGWLEHRHKTSDDPEEFSKRLTSPKLTAALAAWVFAIPDGIRSPEHNRFSLTKLLAVARLPWLWQVENADEVAKELQGLLVSSSDTSGAQFWEDMESRWVTMVRCGYALRVFEEALAQQNLANLKGLISQQRVKKGEFLWQGSAGLCVAAEDFDRTKALANVSVLYLQRPASNGAIRAGYAIPTKGLLDGQAIDLPDVFRTTLLTIFADEHTAGSWLPPETENLRAHGLRP